MVRDQLVEQITNSEQNSCPIALQFLLKHIGHCPQMCSHVRVFHSYTFQATSNYETFTIKASSEIKACLHVVQASLNRICNIKVQAFSCFFQLNANKK